MYVYFISWLLNLVFKYSKIMQQVNKIRLFTPSQVLTDSSFCLSIHVFTKNGWFYLYIFSLDSWYFFFSLDSLFCARKYS